MDLLEEIKREIEKGKDIEEILKKFSWKSFEQIVEAIFQIHGFKTKRNFRFKTKRRFEIDVLAYKNNYGFCVECKKWNLNWNRKSKIKEACLKNEEKCKELRKIWNWKKFKLQSLVVTLWQEDLKEFSKTKIVSIYKLNSFLLEEFLP